MRKQIGRFFGQAEDGTEYEVHVYRNTTNLPPLENGRGLPGLQGYEFLTPTGRPVTRLEEGVYLLAESGLVIRSDQPGAI